MKNPLTLKGYQSIKSIVSRNSDGKEYVVSAFINRSVKDVSESGVKQDHYILSSGSEEVTLLNEEWGNYTMVFEFSPSNHYLYEMKILERDILAILDECYDIFSGQFPNVDPTSDANNGIYQLRFEKIKHDLGYYDLRIKYAELLSLMYIIPNVDSKPC